MTNNLLICAGRATLALLGGLCLLTGYAACQDSGEQGTNMRGSRAEIAVTVRESRQVITVPAVVKLYKNGALEDQRSTSQGRAFFIVPGLGEFSVAVEAAGYKAAQKEISIAVAMQYQEDVYLERDGTSGGTPGGAVLAPKAKEALDRGTGSKEGNWTRRRNILGRP